MSNVHEYRDEISSKLRESISLATLEFEKLGCELEEFSNLKTCSIRNGLTEEVVNKFEQRWKRCDSEMLKTQQQILDISKKCFELKTQIEKLELVKLRLERCNGLVSKLINFQSLPERIEAEIDAENYMEASKLISQYKQYEAEKILYHASDQLKKDNIHRVEKKFVRKVSEHLKKLDPQEYPNEIAEIIAPLTLYEEGLQFYIGFIRESLSKKCKANYLASSEATGCKASRKDKINSGGIYGWTLEKLFASVCRIILDHKQILETHMSLNAVTTFFTSLQEEVSFQVIQVVDLFEKQNQWLLKLPREALSTENLKDADLSLEEISCISHDYHKFKHFWDTTTRNIFGVLSITCNESEAKEEPSNTPQIPSEKVDTLTDKGGVLLSLSSNKVQELIDCYVSLEFAYITKSVLKASEEATINLTSKESNSTMADDIFLMLTRSVTRAISSLDSCAVCALINLIGQLFSTTIKNNFLMYLEKSFKQYIQWAKSNLTTSSSEKNRDFFAFLRDVSMEYKAYDSTAAQLNIKENQLPSPHNACNPKEFCSVKLSWPHLLNDLRTCSLYIERLSSFVRKHFTDIFSIQLGPGEDPSREVSRRDTNVFNNKFAMLQLSLSGLETLRKELELNVSNSGEDLVSNLAKFQIMQKYFERFGNISYEITQEIYIENQINDPLFRSFVSHIEIVLTHLKKLYSEENFLLLLTGFLKNISEQLELIIFTKKITFFGALQLEGEIRYLSTTITDSYLKPLEKARRVNIILGRLLEAVELLSVENIQEMKNILIDPLSMRKIWKLKPEEMKELLLLRTDLNHSELKEFFTVF